MGKVIIKDKKLKHEVIKVLLHQKKKNSDIVLSSGLEKIYKKMLTKMIFCVKL